MQRTRFRFRPEIYTLPSNFLSIRVALGLLLADFVLGILGYMIIEGYSPLDAFYMVVITISTVGYTEVNKLDEMGKLFTSIYVIINIGLIAYFLAVFSYYIIQGEFYKNLHVNMIKKRIKNLNNHIILCGYGKYGKEISTHFERHNIPFLVIDNNEEKIERIQRSDKKTLYILGDATHDEVLQEANIGNARALIAALSDDSDNLFIVLTARQLNPGLTIVSRAKDPRSQKKLNLAGANRIVMPEQIGGFYMATLVTKPDAVEFFSFITTEAQADIGYEEINFNDAPENWKNKSIRDLKIRKVTGANIIGFKDYDQHYVVNPTPDTVLGPGTSFIVLGNRFQLDQLKDYLSKI